MKKLLYISMASAAVLFASCTKSDFEDAYKDPSTVLQTNMPKQYAGFLQSNWEDAIPDYWNYFTVIQGTTLDYTQAHGVQNRTNMFVVGAAPSDRWGRFYSFLTQYRELEKVNAALTPAQQAENRIYMLTATVYLYEHTQKMIDNFGDIPFSEAGKIGSTGGDYTAASAKYDTQEELYTKMLADLKSISAELKTIALTPKITLEFEKQDLINKGNITKWLKYTNSMRLRMLNRVSGTTLANDAEMGQIIAAGDIVTTNADNIEFKIYTQDSDLDSSRFRDAIESNYINAAPKAMIDHMNTNSDPRLPWMFEPGTKEPNKAFIGLNQLLDANAQTKLLSVDATIAFYNRSTFSRNQWFPGVFINAAAMNLLLAEYYVRTGNVPAAKTAYENAVKQSAQFYCIDIPSRSNDRVFLPTTAAPTDADMMLYLAKPGVNFDLATTNQARMQLIASQRYIHYNIIMYDDAWSDLRRTNLPVLTFLPDNSSTQKEPPVRWTYPNSERTYNTVNYEKVSAKDNLTTKIFWDVN